MDSQRKTTSLGDTMPRHVTNEPARQPAQDACQITEKANEILDASDPLNPLHLPECSDIYITRTGDIQVDGPTYTNANGWWNNIALHFSAGSVHTSVRASNAGTTYGTSTDIKNLPPLSNQRFEALKALLIEQDKVNNNRSYSKAT
ncbi:hypothetical protein K1X76_01560 [bacterium]|nr:hypothetical protein [bacterium]